MDGDKKVFWANLLRWTGRVWSSPAILFVGGHLVFPDTEPGAEVFWYEWLAVVMLFLSVSALLLGWWKEKLGGWAAIILMAISMLVYTAYSGEFFPAWWLLLLGIVVPAGMFLGSAFLRDKIAEA